MQRIPRLVVALVKRCSYRRSKLLPKVTARPKSMSLILVKLPSTSPPSTITLPGFRSRCTTPHECMCRTAVPSCAATERSASSPRWPFSFRTAPRSRPRHTSSTRRQIRLPSYLSGAKASITETLKALVTLLMAQISSLMFSPVPLTAEVSTFTATLMPVDLLRARNTSPKAPLPRTVSSSYSSSNFAAPPCWMGTSHFKPLRRDCSQPAAAMPAE
mmetsp:Transcript_36489/g.82486  ORF Transcript_36489/g.82486 Transcript_36489/m.82486 type:complete len:216 (+) Transcript_36489:747-1394(+)